VLSTLHTSDAVETVTRLIDLGVEPWIVANSLLAVLAQRLVRVLCEACAEKHELEQDLLDEDGKPLLLKGAELRRAKGCPRCHQTGYRGRTGIFELLEVDDDLRELIKLRAAKRDYREKIRAAGLIPLRETAVLKAKAGITSLEEVLRVT
jgi:general secretion pathway protein E/type IV pilus assembly protein PilB